MNALDWLLSKRPGKIVEYENRYEISHDSGEHSTLFKNDVINIIPALNALGDTYIKYDGMDLFSSTFKLASMHSAKSVEGIELVQSIKDFTDYALTLNPAFPEESILFMYQAGIAVYAIGKQSGRIYEWDVDELALTGEFGCLEEIFEEWMDAVA